MNRLLLVLAVAPVFALLLGSAIALAMRWGPPGPGGRSAVERLAPVLYAAAVTGAALTAAVLTGFDPVRLGLWPGDRLVLPEAGAGGWVVGVAVGCGVLAGAAGYFGELLFSHRSVRGRGGSQRGGGQRGGNQRGSGPPPRTPAQGMRSTGIWTARPAGLLALGLATGLAEEVLFRGYLLTGLRGAAPLWAALLLQAALFGAHHGSFGLRAVPAKAVHGLVWGLLTVGSGSLLPAVTAHLVFQFLACRRLARRPPGAARPVPAPEGGTPDGPAHGSAAVRRSPLVR